MVVPVAYEEDDEDEIAGPLVAPAPSEVIKTPTGTLDVAEAIGAPGVFDSSGESLIPAGGAAAPTLDEVIQSIRENFPMIQQAIAGRVVASGEALSAEGAFDRKFEAFGNGQPLDFFENQWGFAKLERNTMWGGKVGAGYKLGRGSFEPWFLERETNDGGEFSVTLSAPIGRDVVIDENRAELWRAQLEQNRVEPEIRAMVLLSIRNGSVAYWDWVAAGANLGIARDLLILAEERTGFLETQVRLQEKAGIELTDNQRIIVSRQAKLIDARRKAQQAAVKLSLFFRDPGGAPILLPDEVTSAPFPDVVSVEQDPNEADVALALERRPELAELNVVRRQLSIALRQANNETRPEIDGGMFFGQDVGNPTASDNKSDFEIEATLTVSVPLERRKARGKVRQLQGKIAQLRAKTRFASDKITGEVRAARAALVAAAQRVEQTTEGVRLAEQMRLAEDKRLKLGESNLLNLNIRELQAAEARVARVAALRDYFVAEADYTAARGVDQ